MARPLGVAGIQMEVTWGADNSDAMMVNLNRVALLFPWVDIVIFSELCVCGIDIDLAQPIPNETLDKLAGWAQKEKKWLIPGSFYEKTRDKVYNTAVVISPDGEIIATGKQLITIRRPLYAGDFIQVAFQLLQLSPTGNIPHPNRGIPAGRGQLITVRRPGQTVGFVKMAG